MSDQPLLAERRLALLDRINKSGVPRRDLLLHLARKEPAFSLGQELMIEANLIPGCQARLWLVCEFGDKVCRFKSFSDSRLVRAAAGLLCEFYSGARPGEILAEPPDFLAGTGLLDALTASRRHVLSKVWKKIESFAQSCPKEPA